MMNRKLSFVVIVILLLSWSLASCSAEPTPPPLDTPTPGQGSGGQPAATQPGGQEENNGTVESGGEEPVNPAEASPIPVPEAAYDVHYSRGGDSVQFTVDGDINSVVSFFQEELPNFGWEMAGPPDNAVGVIATMLREDANGDRLTVNMQENSDAGFVRVTAQVARGSG